MNSQPYSLARFVLFTLAIIASTGRAPGDAIFFETITDRTAFDGATGSDRDSDSRLGVQAAGVLTLEYPAIVRSVTWWGIMGQFNVTPVVPISFDLIFYAERDGLPDPNQVISSTTVTFDALTDTGVDLLQDDIYIFKANIEPTALPAGTRAWFSVLADTITDPDDDFLWRFDKRGSSAVRSVAAPVFKPAQNVTPLFVLYDEVVKEGPEMIKSSPGNSSFGVKVDSNLVLTFDERVRKGRGSILIKKSPGNEVVATIDVASAAVTVSESTVTINPPNNLEKNRPYYVEISAGAIEGRSGVPFAGIQGSGKWSFATSPVLAPSLIAHYTFDSSANGVTPDSASANHATLGSNVAIHGSVAGAIGTGVLDVTNSGSGFASGGDGAVTSNDFSWANGARTITFWWKAKVPVADIDAGTYVSFGTDEGSGTLFEINEGVPGTTSDLRVAVGGTTASSDPSDFDNGNWQFVAVTVPEQARLRDIAWYVNGSTTNLNRRISTLAIATGTGPLVFGDSITGVSGTDLSPNGYLDDFQLYDGVLSQGQIAFLYNNPGAVAPVSPESFENYVANPAFGLGVDEKGFNDDPDGDGFANGLEAWLGTDPGEQDASLAIVGSVGTITTFRHPRNGSPPGDVIGFYEWSPNLIDWYAGDGVAGPPGGSSVLFSLSTVAAETEVTATANEAMPRMFIRAGVVRN